MAEFDQYADAYSDQIETDLSFFKQDHFFYLKVKADQLLKHAFQKVPASASSQTKDISILDVGCGHGITHNYLIENGDGRLDLHGTDTAEKVIGMARELNPQSQYTVAPEDHLPYPDDSFDIVTATCVVHHVPPAQWTRFLQEMGRVAKPGGSVVIFEHNPFNPVTSRIVKNCPLDENAVLLSASKLKSHIRAAGLRDDRHDYILFFPIDSAAARLVEKAISWLPLGAQYAVYATKA